MHMKTYHRVTAAVLAGTMALTLLTGCSSADPKAQTEQPAAEQAVQHTEAPKATASPEVKATPAPSASAIPTDPLQKLDSTQRNSIGMLNDLAVLTQGIHDSKDSRLYLEEVYSMLINNCYPNSIDDRTLAQLTNILDTLEKYRMTAVKRERLQFEYEQNHAQAVHALVPNPLGLLSAVRAFSLPSLAASIVYMAADSAVSYMSEKNQADFQYLQENWVLDDEEAAALHESRKDMFSYMIQSVGDYELPGEFTLNENAVEEFVKWKNNDNVVQRIQFLETNEKTYRALATYWIVLAESYYENEQYTECLKAVKAYESLNMKIFRKDYQFAETLVLAIVSADKMLTGDAYIQEAEHAIQLIMENTDYGDWDLHYFVAQTYVDLFHKTGDKTYLNKAYAVVLNNVNSLVNVQKEMNAAYLADTVQIETPKDASKQQKKEIEQHNEALKKERETALPPVYEPLVLNCELLFALADELEIDEGTKIQAERILHQDEERIFLTVPLDNRFWFKPKEMPAADRIELDDKHGIALPAELVSERSAIRTTVQEEGKEPTVIEDWTLDKVERGKDAELSAFMAQYQSETFKKHEFAPDSQIIVEIFECEGAEQPMRAAFKTVVDKKLGMLKEVQFNQVEE